MKKTYIAPASQLKMVAAQQMMAVSLIDDADGTNNAVSKGEGDDGDALVKGDNIWDKEW